MILRITRSKGKTWRYEYRTATAQKKALPLGSHPEISLKQARRLRQEAKELKEQGVDPVDYARLMAVRTKQDFEREVAILEIEQAEPSFLELVDEYVDSLHGSPSQYNVKRSLYKDAVSQWASRKAKSITRRECVLLLDQIKHRAPVQANRLHSFLRAMFNTGIKRGLIEENPMVGISKPAPKADQRDNTGKALDAIQLGALLNALGTKPFDDVIRLMLLTGARPKEVLGMKWSQIEKDTWRLSNGEHKTGHQRNLSVSRPLIPQARAIIEKYAGLHDEYVFTSVQGRPMQTSSLNHFVGRLRNHYGIDGFTPNHLRHTISTRMREIGIRPDVVERIIGHHVDSGIVGVYSSYNWLPEMREALEKWKEWIA